MLHLNHNLQQKDDEGESGTIYSANIGIGKKIKCRSTIDVISTRVTTKGTKAKG
jgi:hypothetical protein